MTPTATLPVPTSEIAPFPSAIRAPLQLLRSPWLRPLNDLAAIDDLLGLVDPVWSLRTIKARVVRACRENADVRTLWLRPNHLWPGHQPGQHVSVEVEISGRRLRRTFSISSPPRADGLLAITVKRRPEGKVSNWWNDVPVVGDVLTLGTPSGNFVLPASLPSKLVMISAGSGITPLMAMLRQLDACGTQSEVEFLSVARSESDALFLEEVYEIASRSPWLRPRIHFTGAAGRMAAADWDAVALQVSSAATFVCGPTAFSGDVQAAWARAGNSEHLQTESFGGPILRGQGTRSETVEASRTKRTFVAAPGQSLLEAAEAAGLRPQSGCRVGVCHTCKCRKVSGVVEDLRDGRSSDEPDEMIQLCVTTARSAVTLEL